MGGGPQQLEKRLDLGVLLQDEEEEEDGLEENIVGGKCEKAAPVTCPHLPLCLPSCFQPASRHASPQLDPDWLNSTLLASHWLEEVITALPLYGYCTASNKRGD